MSSSKSRKTRRQKKRRQSLKRKQKREQQQLQDFGQRLEKDLLQGHRVVIAPRGEVKMSEVLEAFVEPYLEIAETEDATRRLLLVAVLAWNASFLAEEEQQGMIEGIMNEVMPSATRGEREDFRQTVTMLVKRKQGLFSEYTRKIIRFELTDTGEDYHLSVVSTLEEESKG